MSNLPEIHKQAFMFKNTRRLKFDGGRAWVKDAQLHRARKGANGNLITIDSQKDINLVPEQDQEKPSI